MTIKCEICQAETHVIESHLIEAGHEMTIEDYEVAHPNAPIYSKEAEAALEAIREKHCPTNDRVDLPIPKTFGFGRSGKNATAKTISGWKNPHLTTPMVDGDYIFNKDVLSVVLYAIENPNERLLLTGPTGSGKTSHPEQVAARLNLPYSRFSCDSDVTRENFIGQWTLDGNKTVFQYGVLPDAMTNGKLLILDEWDTLNPAVAMLLQSVLEENGRLFISETNEVIAPHPDFRLIATSNTIGLGDESGLYNGTQPQNYAQLNRFTMVEYVGYPDRATERKIVFAKTGIDDETVINNFIDVAGLIRDAFQKGEIMGTMSTRQVVNIARKYLAFGDLKRAYQLAFSNLLNTEDRRFTDEILNRVWGL